MFATLDPTSRRLRLPHEQEVILNDTVGFIRDLPPDLIAAFRATLEEISDSNVLIHLIDAANPRREQQLESVEKILTDLELNSIPRLVVFNKSDLVDPDTLEASLRQTCEVGSRRCVAVSALDPRSLLPMLEAVGSLLARDLTARPGARNDAASPNDESFEVSDATHAEADEEDLEIAARQAR
jgi:GTP-binding protein HflX